MKQILDASLITFTPGGAGSGTIAIAGLTGFHPSRVMAITNVTRKRLLFAVELGEGSAGVWSSVTSTGGTLTLDADSSSHDDLDVVRVIYESAGEETALAALEDSIIYRNTGRNILQRDINDWNRGTNVVSVTDSYGESPIPGRRSKLLTMTAGGDAFNVSTYLNGRTDGVGFTFSFWARDPNGVGLSIASEMRAQDGAGFNEFIVNSVSVITGEWKRFYIFGICTQANATLILCNLYYSAGGSIEVDGLMLEFGDGPSTYSPPAFRRPDAVGGYYKAQVPLVPRSSIYMIGDSFVGGANSVEHRTELSRLTGGSVIYNAGVGGETSTQILARLDASLVKYGWVVIEAGRNDGSGISTTLSNIASMVAAIPHGRFIICPVMNSSAEPMGGGTCEYIEDLNSQLIARYGDHIANYRPIWIAGRADHTPRPEYLSDTLHPSAAGHGIIARAIADAMIKLGAPFASHSPVRKLMAGSNAVAFTRPANTTAYTAGDLVANDATAGSVVAMRIPWEDERPVRRLRLMKSTVSLTNAAFRVHLFSLPPTSAAGDNAAFSSDGAANYLGRFAITVDQALTDGAVGTVDLGAHGIAGKDPTKAAIYALIEATAAYTPGSAEVFTLTAEYGAA